MVYAYVRTCLTVPTKESNSVLSVYFLYILGTRFVLPTILRLDFPYRLSLFLALL